MKALNVDDKGNITKANNFYAKAIELYYRKNNN